jgi:hypothetical protein
MCESQFDHRIRSPTVSLQARLRCASESCLSVLRLAALSCYSIVCSLSCSLSAADHRLATQFSSSNELRSRPLLHQRGGEGASAVPGSHVALRCLTTRDRSDVRSERSQPPQPQARCSAEGARGGEGACNGGLCADGRRLTRSQVAEQVALFKQYGVTFVADV